MSSSEEDRFQFRVSDSTPGLTMVVFSADDRICASGTNGTIDVSLPRGLYTLRSELNGLFEDKLIRHVSDSTYTPILPKRFTAAPIENSATSHEYYTDPAHGISCSWTQSPITWNGPENSSFMLFIRALDMNRSEPGNLAKKFKLCDSDGKTVTTFEDSNVKIGGEFGYTGFSAIMSSGLLILEDSGKTPRQIPIRLYDGFQTQLFLMYHGRPLFEDLRVFSPTNHTIEDPEFVELIDAGLFALQNGVNDIGQSIVSRLLYSKFQNPVLGLLGAYLMILRRRQSPGKCYDTSVPLETVIENLAGLMPNTADVAALRLLASPWLGEPPLEPIHDVPLFRVGTETLIRAAAEHPELIPDGSLLDTISDRLHGDTAWTSWEPLPPPSRSSANLESTEPFEDVSWVEIAIADAIGAANRELDAADLARQIGVTRHTVQRAFKQLVHRTADQPDQIRAIGHDVTRMKLGLASRTNDDLKAQLAPLLQRLAEESVVTYQSVYPQIKELLSTVSGKDVSMEASDHLDAIIDKWSEPSTRKRFLGRLKQHFLVDLDQSMLGDSDTLSDITQAIVNKTKKEGARNLEPPTSPGP